MAATQGYRTQQKLGQPQYQTFQQVGRAGGGSYAADTVSKVLFDTTPLNDLVEAGSTQTVLVATAHGALPGDMIRFILGTANPSIEVGVVSVTTDTITLGGALPAAPTAGDAFKIMRWITPTADSNGSLVFTPGPTTFNQDGVITTVAEDTANPANNKGLPVNIVFYKDGVPVTVNVDSVTPANNRLLPVELSSLAGPINVTAGDLNVAISATNDSVALGDPVTGLLANVTTNATTNLEELHVTDDGAIALLTTIDGDTSALAANIGTVGAAPIATGVQALGTDGTLATRLKTNAAGQLEVVGISSALPAGAATLAEQQTQTTALNGIRTSVELIDNSANVDGVAIGTAGLAIGGRDSLGNFQQMAVATTGEVLVSSTTLASEATLSALNAKVANDFGVSTGAVRTASQIGNATGAADFNAGVDGAQTLRVSANLKRAGTELSYNTGIADANTLRSVLATRHETVTTPLATRLSDGTNFITSEAIAAAQKTVAGGTQTSLLSTSVVIGWDGVTHRELLTDTSGRLQAVSKPAALAYEDARSALIANTGVTTIAIPAGTVKFKVQANDTNTVNLRMRIDADPTATAGMQLQAGRSEDYECTGTQLRFIAESAATGQAVEVHFFKA